MEHQYGAKYVPELRRLTSASTPGAFSSPNTTIIHRPRRPSFAAATDFPAQYENSWSPRGPAVLQHQHHHSPHLSIMPRRQAIYGHHPYQRFYIHRPVVGKISSSNEGPPSLKMLSSECEKPHPPPIASMPSSQPQPQLQLQPHPQPQPQPQPLPPQPPPAQHQTNTTAGGRSASTVELTQARLEQRVEALSRRIRRLQHFHSSSYVENELNSTVSSLRRALDNATAFRKSETINDFQSLLNDSSLEQKLENLIKTGELRSETFNCAELRSANPSSLVLLLRKYEPCLKQILAVSSAADIVSSAPAAATSVPAALDCAIPSNVALDTKDRQCLNRVTDSLQSHLNDLQAHYDSDATESSSGGESCDEDEKEAEDNETKSFGKSRHSNLRHRASWQWWTERAWLGSRWSWIQFQLADLEYKIRQHVDLHKQLRCRKQSGTLPLPSASSLNRTSSVVTSNLKLLPGQRTTGGKTAADEDDNDSSLDGCARTRPVECGPRRRIIRTAGMFRWNRKTYAQSSVPCGCFPPYSPCVTCGGRVDPIETVDVQSQTKNQRNAILEPTYHPILSASKNRGIGLNRALESHFRFPKKVSLSNAQWFPLPKTIITLLPNSREDSYLKRSGSSPPLSERTAIKSNRGRRLGSTMLSKRRHSVTNRRKIPALKRARLRRAWSRSYSSATMGNGDSSSSSIQDDLETDAGKLGSRRATDKQSTFDIDNIVIDPRVAAVSRVEKIQYKEILTPEWRIREMEGNELERIEDDCEKDTEDVSDTAFLTRHDVKEAEEKKRFIPILFRDLHSAARRAQLFNHSSLSTDSNGSTTAAPPTTLATPAVTLPPPPSPFMSNYYANMINNEKCADNGASAGELSYEPFPLRNFPLNDEELHEIHNICNDEGFCPPPHAPPPVQCTSSADGEYDDQPTPSI